MLSCPAAIDNVFVKTTLKSMCIPGATIYDTVGSCIETLVPRLSEYEKAESAASRSTRAKV